MVMRPKNNKGVRIAMGERWRLKKKKKKVWWSWKEMEKTLMKEGEEWERIRNTKTGLGMGKKKRKEGRRNKKKGGGVDEARVVGQTA